ncbi:hypothetical protein FCV55_20995 [Vibrio sp. F13]|uniref:hypothetical protein n=1 Tax=Vibrio sp. F13 TaxID=2070777 RepID=UPI0010BD6591|nr:hypothetical protein [Vibrio sp. F13]TKF64171.1 hypothetical protein FCV55_20995 [Vibrio sp. F13]
MAKRGRPPKRTKAKDKLFFEILENGGSFKQAAEVAGYSYSLIMKTKRVDEEFAEAIENAEIIAGEVRFQKYKEMLDDMVENGWVEKKTINKKTGDKLHTEIVKTEKRSIDLFKFAIKAEEAGRFNFERDVRDDSELEAPPIKVEFSVSEPVRKVEVTRGKAET